MPLVSSPAVVLQSYAYSETSKILRVLTPEHGVRSLLAKGAIRPRSRFGGLLEPFTGGVADFFLKEGRDLHTLGGWELLHNRQALGRDLVGFAGASLLAELILRFGTEDVDPRLFDELSAALDKLLKGAEGEREAAAVSAAWRIVTLLGFAPLTDSCVGCGQDIQPDEPARFDPAGGGVSCAACRPGRRTFDAGSRRELRRMIREPSATMSFERPGIQRELLQVFLSHQLADGRPLRSLELFIEQAVS